jgi:RecB family exonuclease
VTRAAPWSFSKLKAFDTCPKQFYHEKVLKEYPFVQTDAILYGNEFHKACENYIGDEEPLPKKFIYVKNALDALNDKRGVKLCEKKLGITADLEPCGFYDKRVWFRGIADLLIIDVVGNMAWVVDYKTGKSAKYADKGQLELMALSVFAHYPDIDRVKAGLFFVVAGDLVKDTYKTLDKVSLWKKWMTNYARMETAFEADVWNPRPSGLCRRHCQVTECPHNGSN